MSSELTSALGSIAQSMGADKFIIEKTNEFIDTKFREPHLVASIEGLLKEKYGEDSFYNDLTAHINNHNIITKLINMFYSIGTSDIASKERFVQECLNSFCKDYSISPYEHSGVRKCYELIYDEVYKKIIVLNQHTNLGKIQTSISIAGSQNHNEHTAQMDVLTKILQNTSLLVQNQNAMSVPSKEDLGPVSEAITVFLKKNRFCW